MRPPGSDHQVDRGDRRRDGEVGVERGSDHDQHSPLRECAEANVAQQASDSQRRHARIGPCQQQPIADAEPVLAGPSGVDQDVARLVGSKEGARLDRVCADLGLFSRVHTDREQIEDLLVLPRERADQQPALGNGCRLHDAGNASNGLHRTRREAVGGERAHPKLRLPELLSCSLSNGVGGGLVGEQRAGHHRHPERDAEDGERGSQAPRGEATPGQGRQAHRLRAPGRPGG